MPTADSRYVDFCKEYLVTEKEDEDEDREVGEGGQAFPLQEADTCGWTHRGMTLRDYFAGQALAGMSHNLAGMLGYTPSAYAKGPHNEALADRAYALADAMLRERAK